MKSRVKGSVLGPPSGAADLGVQPHAYYSVRSVLGWSCWILSSHCSFSWLICPPGMALTSVEQNYKGSCSGFPGTFPLFLP